MLEFNEVKKVDDVKASNLVRNSNTENSLEFYIIKTFVK